MDIKSSNEYPSCELSNFCAHEFIFREQKISSMEALLQSIKVQNAEEQKKFFGLVGFTAKKAGKPYKWFDTNSLLARYSDAQG